MSVTANIVLESKPDALMIKSSAIKTRGGSSYVEVLANGVPQQKNITAGDSNDTMTEITSGLNEGEEIITQTISGSANVQTSASGGNSMMMLGGAGGPRD